MIGLLQKLRNELGVTIISATRDLKMLKCSDRILWIRDGSVHKIGTSAEITMDALKT